MITNLTVNIGKLKLENPVMVCSGTFGYAGEFKDFLPLKKLGAIVTKTITLNPRQGNFPPRTCETPAGMLNSIGLENPGLAGFLNEKLPILKKIGVPVIVSVASEGGIAEFVKAVSELNDFKEVAAIELNISCPNIESPVTSHLSPVTGRQSPVACRRLPVFKNRRLISQDPQATYQLVKQVRKATKKTLITKLSPNVTDISEIALAAENAGSDAVSLINTLMGMSIDTKTMKPKVAAVIAGLSGPAIRPVAVRMVWEVYQKIKLPIIGMGGIIDTSSALEFFLAGSTAIGVGTANFIDPAATISILQGIKSYLRKNRINNIAKLIGGLKV
ncbi:MAG: dihydroorotate dehydrogenase [Candidatus Omnitrophica bacterium]|nr:dihydroorotate dehydrogenase [Candidatus Omnitrophota bacterium]